MKYKAVLLDLDGTLINNDRNKFGDEYIKLVYRRFPKSISFPEFEKAIYTVFTAMIKNDGTRTNEQLFKETFFPLIDYPADEGIEIFHQAHKEDFPRLKDPAEKIPGVENVVKELFTRGLKVVIATNPIFPAELNYERLRWAGVDGLPYHRITSYENSRFAKPNLLYFQEILDHIGVAPEQALMVGDEHMDMVARDVGIDTFFVKSAASDLTDSTPPPTYRGSLGDLPGVL